MRADISIVIAIRDTGARLLSDCIESIAAASEMSAARVEVLLSDDGSSAENLTAYAEILERSGARVCPYILSGRRLGLAEARNRGIEAARGDWICIVDADDVVAPGLFQEVGRFHTDDVDYLLTDHVKVSSDLSTVVASFAKARYMDALARYGGSIDDPLLHFTFTGHCQIFRRGLFDEIGPFKHDDVGIVHDVEWLLRASQGSESFRRRTRHVPKALYLYRDNPAGYCNSGNNREKMWRSLESLFLTVARSRGLNSVECRRRCKLNDGCVHYEHVLPSGQSYYHWLAPPDS